MKKNLIALLIFGEPGSIRNALTEEKYKKLAAHFIEKGFEVDSVLYHDSISGKLATELLKYNALLVWVNPIEQQGDRKILDALLAQLSSHGCFVSAHPGTILKLGTKEILYKVKDTEFGGDVNLYNSFEEFKKHFSKEVTGVRILKQYRGNGGDGVYKVDTANLKNNKVIVTHAKSGNEEMSMTLEDLFLQFESYFNNDGMLIEQKWNPNIINGMVRCYLSGSRVTGFGYQEINALYPIINGIYKKPSQRFYYTEDCRLFKDLKEIMEKSWVSQLQKLTGLNNEELPVIWDADFFINKINSENAVEKYSLCEINASCVSPFPESSIPYIVDMVKEKIKV